MKAHLLYVEDDESLGFVTRDSLEMEGYEVTHFSDGKSADPGKFHAAQVLDMNNRQEIARRLERFLVASISGRCKI